jgi:LysM repeat protein
MFARHHLPLLVLFVLLPFITLTACERQLSQIDPEEREAVLTVPPWYEPTAAATRVVEDGPPAGPPATSPPPAELATAPESSTSSPAATLEAAVDPATSTPPPTRTRAPVQPTVAPTASLPTPSRPATATQPAAGEPAPAPTAIPSTAATEGPSPEAEAIFHTVARGENLFRIGMRYNISWQILAELNGITDPGALLIGQKLLIPMPEPAEPTPSPTPSPGATAAVTPALTLTPSAETLYVVRSGDSLYDIGQMFDVSWVAIAEANGIINPGQITAGMVLKIPSEAPGFAPEFNHVVGRGESLVRISLTYGVPWRLIAEANGIEPPYVIFPGQTLIIPGA